MEGMRESQGRMRARKALLRLRGYGPYDELLRPESELTRLPISGSCRLGSGLELIGGYCAIR